MRTQFGASRPITAPGSFDARGQVMAGKRGERNRMASQHPVQQVVGRDYIE
jgi:hypothetical protein